MYKTFYAIWSLNNITFSHDGNLKKNQRYSDNCFQLTRVYD